MSGIKSLAKQTALYGLSSILGRFLNYLLTPLLTSAAIFTSDQYGIITEMYAYVAFLIVLLTYGMETAFFRFSTQEDADKPKIYTTVVLSVLTTSTVFILIGYFFNQPIANWLHYPENKEFVTWFAIIVALDALSSIPQARLRLENKALTFAFVNLANVFINIGLNLLFLVYCKSDFEGGTPGWLTQQIYNPEIGVGYVFIANLIASICKFLLLLPFIRINLTLFDAGLLKKMLKFAYPLLFVGLAGIVNETVDRILLKKLLWSDLGETATLTQLGIYGANYKLSIIITLFIQAFRYAAEPFFFNQAPNKNAPDTFAKVMNYFVILTLFMFLAVTQFIHIFKYFTPNSEYWQGLIVVPVLLMANVFLGIYYNQSIWYKLANRTKMGAWTSVFGAIITIVLNLIFIPYFGYIASAWATLACYFGMVTLSYILGNKYYPIPYDLKKIAIYMIVALALFFFGWKPFPDTFGIMDYALSFGILLVYSIIVYLIEKPTLKFKS
ncbi:MAG: polysaccharide biosynthesis C-terminal domain-containing protein [Flavobacteriales bacterium]